MAHPSSVKMEEIKSPDIWLLTEGHCLRHQVLDVCDIRRKSNHKSYRKQFQFESGSLETLKNLIDTYGGYTLLPALAQDHIGRSSRLTPFQKPIPSRLVGLIYQREHYKIKLIESLAEQILSSLPESISKLRAKDLEVMSVR